MGETENLTAKVERCNENIVRFAKEFAADYLCDDIDSDSVDLQKAVEIAEKISWPVILCPAFTLGGTGGGFTENEEEFISIMKNALEFSPVRQVLIEKSVKGYKEIEYEVMSIERSFEESLLKSVRSLETGAYHLHINKFDKLNKKCPA